MLGLPSRCTLTSSRPPPDPLKTPWFGEALPMTSSINAGSRGAGLPSSCGGCGIVSVFASMPHSASLVPLVPFSVHALQDHGCLCTTVKLHPFLSQWSYSPNSYNNHLASCTIVVPKQKSDFLLLVCFLNC